MNADSVAALHLVQRHAYLFRRPYRERLILLLMFLLLVAVVATIVVAIVVILILKYTLVSGSTLSEVSSLCYVGSWGILDDTRDT